MSAITIYWHLIFGIMLVALVLLAGWNRRLAVLARSQTGASMTDHLPPADCPAQTLWWR
jgi:hypothetical protein